MLERGPISGRQASYFATRNPKRRQIRGHSVGCQINNAKPERMRTMQLEDLIVPKLSVLWTRLPEASDLRFPVHRMRPPIASCPQVAAPFYGLLWDCSPLALFI